MKPILLLSLSLFSFHSLFAQDNVCPCDLPDGQEPMIRWADLGAPFAQQDTEPVAMPMVFEQTNEVPIYQTQVQDVVLEETFDLEEEFRQNRPDREHLRKKRRNRWFRFKRNGRAKRYRFRCPKGF